jgi:3-methyladenine DNA glycosylase/8-oxoguanine DNA glycosylase
MAGMTGVLEIEASPPWPFRLGRAGGPATRRRGDVVTRLLQIDGRPVVVHAWQRSSGDVVLRAASAARPDGGGCKPSDLRVAIERMRFTLGVDDDLSDFFARFKRDELIGRAMVRKPWTRPRRRPTPWEALYAAIAGQLIEASRAAQIERRMVRRWGPRLEPAEASAWRGPGPLRDAPDAELIAGRAPAELAAMDLSPGRSLAMIRCAKEVAAGRVDLADASHDRRLRAIRDIGPWTLQCLGFHGRGDPDSLPAGDLAFVKLVGRLAGLRRKATVPEVEEFFARYEPYRGLAATFALKGYHLGIDAGPPLRLAA